MNNNNEREIIKLPHDAILFKNAFNNHEQQYITKKCFEFRSPYDIEINDSLIYTPLFAWKYPGMMFRDYTYRKREEEESDYFDQIISMVKSRLDIMNIKNFQPCALRTVLYPKNGSLHVHQDMFMGYVCSVSIGAACDFFFGPNWQDDDKERCTIKLNSGDIILLNGQKYHHGVSCIHDENTPQWWIDEWQAETIPLHWARLNLQFRHMK